VVSGLFLGDRSQNLFAVELHLLDDVDTTHGHKPNTMVREWKSKVDSKPGKTTDLKRETQDAGILPLNYSRALAFQLFS